MNDLISRQAAINALSRGSGCGNSCARGIKRIPSVDAVPVVRCKDCKHRPTMPENSRGVFDLEFPDDECHCQCGDPWYNREPEDDWFCANGERSEGA